MPITSYEPQPTGVPVAPEPTAAEEPPPRPGRGRRKPEPQPEAATPGTPGDGLERVGIVFVHGIGAQTASETFLDWSRPLVELLGEWQHSRTGETYDPVVRSRFSFHPAAPPILELRIPPTTAPDPVVRAESRWLITEAWWAADLRAPSFTEAREFLGRRLPAIVSGIGEGYHVLAKRLKPRRDERAAAFAEDGATPDARAADLAAAATRRWRWVDRLDELQAKAFGLAVLVVPLATLALLVLGGYSLLRRIPFGPLRSFVELRILDSFLVEWFGDLSILLGDATQAANIRARVADAVDRVVAEGATSVVLVAHSGGAIVSFETLADRAYADRTVAKLVTLGEGLKLARELAHELPHERLTAGSRVQGDLSHRKDLRWVDIWASYDPAPAGPFPSTDGLAVVPPDQAEDARRPGVTVIEDRPVTNRMNVLRDHGAYWENPEGFLIPLVRHLDDPHGSGANARFYPTPTDRWARIERRRQRVGVLAGWDWLVSLSTIALIVLFVLSDVLATLARVGSPLAGRLGRTGDLVASVVGGIPGATIVTGPIDGLAGILGLLATQIDGVLAWPGRGPASSLLAGIAAWGPGLLGLAVLIAAGYVIASIGNSRWAVWDRDEGRTQLRQTAPTPDRRGPATTAIALLALLLAFVLGVLTANLALAVVIAVLGVAVADLLRLTWAAPPEATIVSRRTPPAG